MFKTFLILGSFLSGLGVALGAFGAHVLKARLSEQMLATFETGVRYQMYHGLALLFISWLVHEFSDLRFDVSGWLFVVGIVIFSGSLYAVSLSGLRWLGAITPLGGLCFIGGWLWLVWVGIQKLP